jgi:hypothetical protein
MDDYYVIDTHIVDYLAGAMARGVGTQSTDPRIAEQETAAFRLFLWGDLSVGRVALNEVRAMANAPKRDALERLVGIHLGEVWVADDRCSAWETRTAELHEHHKGLNDCRIVSEAEMTGGTVILTFDDKMKRRLSPVARIPILSPTEAWERLAIPRGTPPNWRPRYDNPLSTLTWWTWESE